MAGIKRANTSGITKTGTAIPDVPDAPTIGTATNVGTSRAYNNGSATVTYTAAATGGAVTTFTATSSPGGFTATGSSPITVTGLASGTAYTFTVKGTNATATGPDSSASSSITATTVPQAPTIGTATAGIQNASVTFTAGATGGSSITGYTVTSSPGSITGTGSSSPITVSGLTGGTAYTFTVTGATVYDSDTISLNSNAGTNQDAYFSTKRPSATGGVTANASIRWEETVQSWKLRDVLNSDTSTAFANIITSNAVSSTTQAGIVQLTDSTTSTSTTTAATPNSVKSTFDRVVYAYAHANSVYNYANTGYAQANAAFAHANAAFDMANSDPSFANGAFIAANSAASFANGAFVSANSAASFANGAFAAANSAASFANGAFTKANTVTDYALSSIFSIKAGTGLSSNVASGTGNVELSLATSGVNAGIYGGQTQIPVYTVDSTGRITSTANVSIIAGATLTNDDTTNAITYPVFAGANNGSFLTAYTSYANYTYNPSTGTLTVTNLNSQSDASLKGNVETVTNAVNTVQQLKGV